jgi:signal transduction histidine kinase
VKGGNLMGKLTIRLIKYYISIITAVILICFIASSLFLSLIYTKMEYTFLKNAAHEYYNYVKNGSSNVEAINNYQVSSVFLVRNGSAQALTSSRMGMMQFVKNMDFSSLQEQGKYRNPMNEEFLYYKYSTDEGDIIVLQNNKFSTTFLKITYLILLLIFIFAILISIPVVAFVGKKLTQPILKLQKAAFDITNGHYKIDVDVNTKDEIEELSTSIKFMADTLERKNTLQRDFIANVSHDFKTPLSVIRNYSEAIYDDIVDKAQEKNYLKDIIQEVDRLNLLVMDILQLSKLQGGMNLLEKNYFNLSEFLLSFENAFKIFVVNKGIDLSITAPDIDIYGDVKYLYRVVYNFIDNAIKFSNENALVEVDASIVNDGIKVSIKNFGEGIDKNIINDIWDRYYKSSESGGMGLGLAISSEILKLHDFKYGVVSTKGAETEFYFIVPKNMIVKNRG